MKTMVFCVSRPFRQPKGNHRLHLQGRRVSGVRNQLNQAVSCIYSNTTQEVVFFSQIITSHQMLSFLSHILQQKIYKNFTLKFIIRIKRYVTIAADTKSLKRRNLSTYFPILSNNIPNCPIPSRKESYFASRAGQWRYTGWQKFSCVI
jgi:hypothetical protein